MGSSSSITAALTLADATVADIHRLGTDEVERCKAIRLACLADAPYAFGSTYEGEVAQGDDWWRQRLTDGQWYVAHRDGVDLAVAMLTYQPLPETFEPLPQAPTLDREAALPWVRAVWTQPEHRGQGLVDLLLAHLSDSAAATGATAIILGVRDGNERAVGAYRRIGFETVGRFWPSSGGVPQPNLLMAKSLLERTD